jgi:hypothetical protein
MVGIVNFGEKESGGFRFVLSTAPTILQLTDLVLRHL